MKIFDSSRVTRKINLKDNDGLSAYDNHACQQTELAFEVFFNFFKKIQPSNLLEIGTALGGFTSLMKIFLNELNINCNVLTYDVISYAWYDDMRARDIDVRVENIFTENYEVKDLYVPEYIRRSGTTVVLCDGGSKKDEFRALAPFLKQGDFILAHDYCRDREIFEQRINKVVWNWCEIVQEDIAQPCEENNLSVYDEDVFNNVAWTCRIKN